MVADVIYLHSSPDCGLAVVMGNHGSALGLCHFKIYHLNSSLTNEFEILDEVCSEVEIEIRIWTANTI